MCSGLSDDLLEIDDTRKTAIIDRELAKRDIDIAALQETRLAASGSLKEKEYTFFWQGLESDERRIHGVGFAVRNSILPSVEPPSKGTERILSLRLTTSYGPTNILSIYAPTLCSSTETKDFFYEELAAKIRNIPEKENLLMLGDFNARIGADHSSWPHCIGHFGVGRLNDNGQRLLELCSFFNLCITNTFFSTKPHHRVSWRHPRSKHWHQLDLVITRRAMLNHVLLTRSYHSADCDTDHSLVGSKVRLLPRAIHRSKQQQKSRPRIDTSGVLLQESRERFSVAIDKALDDCPTDCAQVRWDFIRDATYKAAFDSFGKKAKKNEDWFEAGIEEMKPAISAKGAALLEYKRQPSERTLAAYREARNNTKKVSRKCANDYWLKLCGDIQSAAEKGNTRAMYEGMKKAFGPSVIRTAPLKSKSGEILKDRGQQMERWAEHYGELYSRVNLVSDNAIINTKLLPTMDELDTPPTIDELMKAIDSLSCGKAPGSDGIPPEIVKAGRKNSLLGHLHGLLLQCWKEGTIPQDMRDAKIVTLYKNKGDRSDCNNYRGISLLSIVGKAFARVVLNRLQTLADRVYPESQCGFRAKRSTIDMVYCV